MLEFLKLWNKSRSTLYFLVKENTHSEYIYVKKFYKVTYVENFPTYRKIARTSKDLPYPLILSPQLPTFHHISSSHLFLYAIIILSFPEQFESNLET